MVTKNIWEDSENESSEDEAKEETYELGDELLENPTYSSEYKI